MEMESWGELLEWDFLFYYVDKVTMFLQNWNSKRWKSAISCSNLDWKGKWRFSIRVSPWRYKVKRKFVQREENWRWMNWLDTNLPLPLPSPPSFTVGSQTISHQSINHSFAFNLPYPPLNLQSPPLNLRYSFSQYISFLLVFEWFDVAVIGLIFNGFDRVILMMNIAFTRERKLRIFSINLLERWAHSIVIFLTKEPNHSLMV